MPPTTLSADVIVASDIHLTELDDLRGRLLLDALSRIEPSTRTLILNGDIFDFCFGSSAYYRRKYAALGAALSRIARAGTRVLFIEGNHDFHMQDIGWDGVEITAAESVTISLEDGKLLKIGHGDLIKDDFWYRMFRGLVKSRFLKAFALLVPGRWLDAYTLFHARVSRSRDEYRQLDHGAVLASFDRWLGEQGHSYGVMGHYHVPYAEARPSGQAGTLFCVPSWDEPNFLLFRGERIERAFVTEVGAPFRIEPARPYLAN